VPLVELVLILEYKEYADLQKKPLEGIKIVLPAEADMHQWQIHMDGPKGSPYEVLGPTPTVLVDIPI